MADFNLLQATGLTPQELSEVLQQNPRAYMAVRGAVSEKHLKKILKNLQQQGVIPSFRSAAGDMDKDFYVQMPRYGLSIECKNVEVIKTSTKKSKISYLEYLSECGYLSDSVINDILDRIYAEVSIRELSSAQLTEFYKCLPQDLRESGLAKYEYSSSLIPSPAIGSLPDDEYVAQFDELPLTIDFQRTRNSTDEDGDNRQNRFYRVDEIDVVAACLFARTLEWRFLYAKAEDLEIHQKYPARYSNKLKLVPGIWSSDILKIISRYTKL